jgi:hypothetical protein
MLPYYLYRKIQDNSKQGIRRTRNRGCPHPDNGKGQIFKTGPDAPFQRQVCLQAAPPLGGGGSPSCAGRSGGATAPSVILEPVNFLIILRLTIDIQ